MGDSRLIVRGGSGGTGGGSASTPTEHPDSLRSKAIANLVDALCEGPIEGFDDADPLKVIFYDEVPIKNADGSTNFEGVTIHSRLGTPTQSVMPGFNDVESEINVNRQVTKSTPSPAPQLFTIADTDVDAVRIKVRIPSLQHQQESGDLVGSSVQLKIEVLPSLPDPQTWTELVDDTITGKTSSPYERAYRIDLSTLGTYPLQFRVSRVTDDSTEASLQNDLFLNSYTEIQEVRMMYSDTAVVGHVVDSELFGGRVPRRSYRIKGLQVQHPSNWNPTTRAYTGFWDGTFTIGFCNHPVWVLYDILTNKRYGLGDSINAEQIDKFALYAIAQYCDELVPDGKGGTEPRYTFNGVIATREEAFTVVNAIVSTFDGMAFWSAGGVTAVADRPTDPTRLYTPANVINGEFNYSSTGLSTRHSVALVTWNNPANQYKKEIEVVEDPALIDRFGWKPVELVAIGTTSQGQAHRKGLWALHSESNITETCTWSAGLDSFDIRPGEVVEIMDPVRNGAKKGGRLLGSSIFNLTPTTAATATFAINDNAIASVSSYAGDGIENDADATFQCSIRVPSTAQPSGVIWELGDNTTGAYLGFDSNGDLVLRAGDGAASPAVNDSAMIVVPNSRITTDRTLDLLWEVRINPGRVRLWINGQWMGEDGTADGSSLEGSAMASSNDGGYGKSSGAIVDGETATDFSGTILSKLSYWRDTLVNALPDLAAVDYEFDDGETIASVAAWTGGAQIDRNNNGLIEFSFELPADPTEPEGCILDLGKGTGGTNSATYVGFDGNNDMVIRMGDGTASPDITKYARLVIPRSTFVRDRVYHMMIEWKPSIGQFRVWLDYELKWTAQTSGGGPFNNDEIAQGDDGGYGTVGGDTTVQGEVGSYDQDFNGTLRSQARYRRGQQMQTWHRGIFNYGTVTLDRQHTAAAGDVLHIVTADGHIDALRLDPTGFGVKHKVLDRPKKALNPNANWVILGVSLVPTKWRVQSMREQDATVEITALEYDETKWAKIEEDIILAAPPTSNLPTGAAQPPSNLAFAESLHVINDAVQTRIDLTWSGSTDPRVGLYRVQVQGPDGIWQTLPLTPAFGVTIPNAQAGLWSFRVASVIDATIAGAQSSMVELLNQNIFGKTLPPGDVTGLQATRGITTVTLNWNDVTDLDLVGYEVRQGATWDSGTVITKLHIGTHLTVELDTTANVTFHVRAIDQVGIYSQNVASVTTSIQGLSAVSDFYVYQSASGTRAQWTGLSSAANIQYELRHGPTSGDYDTATPWGTAGTPTFEKPFTVNASTTFRFYVKPFIKLASGTRSYGPAVSFDKEIHPRIGNNPVKTQSEHTSWTGVLDAIGSAPTRTPDEDVAEGNDLNAVVSWVDGGSPNVARGQSGIFELTLQVSSTGTATGCVFELGNSSRGGYLGFDSSGDLIFRAGDGAASWDVNDIARVVIPKADYPKDQDFTILCDIRCDGSNSGRVRVWIDGVKVAEDATNDSSSFSTWANNADGRYKGFNDSIVAGESGSYSQDPELSNVTLSSNLRYWSNEVVETAMEVTGSDELALKADQTVGGYRYTIDLTSETFGRFWHEETALFLSTDSLKIFDATMFIHDATFPITPVVNAEGSPRIKFIIEFDTEVPFEDAFYQFTLVTIRVEFRRDQTDTSRPALSALTTYFDVPDEMP